jgi:RNA polymerase sigma-70 factor (ECF subfamily)
LKDDAELVAKAQAGDEDAFTALYQAHVGSVRAVCRQILRTEDLDDVCQETFLRAFARIHTFAGKAGFRTWVTRIAINQSLMTLRRRRQESNGENKLVAVDFEALADDVTLTTRDAALENVAVRLDVEKMLRGLKPLQRKMVEMAYMEEWQDAEITQMLGVSAATLSSTLYFFKRRLRDFAG